MGVGGQRHAPAALPPERDPVPVVQGGREVNVHPDNTHLRLSISLHSSAQYNVNW